ncbi:IS110 family transposase [uncultured Succinatimonas sp.]|uniref:IS110 family transposase n=1 Tax=uncultured Succinatimonas sp. TaxID=1262973 RepID=UPI0025EF16B3|nr:IS110 family transposase [uncultured Succinatimonas sp.]
MTIPYVGPVTAAAMYAVMFDPDNFKNARQFTAYAGFAPTLTGTGCKVVMDGILLKGNPVLKQVLY